MAAYVATLAAEALTQYKDTSWRDLGLDNESKNQKKRRINPADLKGHFATLGFLKKRIQTVEGAIQAAEFVGEFPGNLIKELRTLIAILDCKGKQSVPKLKRAYAHASTKLQFIAQKAAKAVKEEHAGGASVASHSKPIQKSANAKKFNILFLSDLHWKGDASQARWNSVQGGFFEALEKAYEDAGNFDVVIFGGDLVFSGAKNQFFGSESVADFFEKLRKCLAKLGCRCPILSVPGNHDLERPVLPDMDEARTKAFLDKLYKEACAKDGKGAAALVKNAFSNYTKWDKKNIKTQVADGIIVAGTEGYRRGKLPGDFCCRLKKDGLNVGVVGLNSAYLQLLGGNLKGMLRVDRDQFDNTLPKERDAWLKENQINILITHHPVDWLEDTAQATLQNDIFIPNLFALQLNGHMHREKWGGVIVSPNTPQYRFQSASLFSEVPFTDETDLAQKLRTTGYCVIQFDLGKSGVSLRFRPRTFNEYGQECHVSSFPLDGENGWTKAMKVREPKIES